MKKKEGNTMKIIKIGIAIIILIAIITLVFDLKANAQSVIDPMTGELIELNISDDGEVEMYNYDTGDYSYNQIDSDRDTIYDYNRDTFYAIDNTDTDNPDLMSF